MEYRLKEENGKYFIFDTLRKKFLVLTPEEWVRQHIIYYLVNYKQYPKSLFVLEKGLKYNLLNKRFDVLVLNRGAQPFLLIECKAPEVKLCQKTVEQVCLYNKTLGAEYLAITNGKQHICMQYEKQKEQISQINSFPDFI